MNGFRNTKRRACVRCIYFQSWFDFFDRKDPLEPEEYGKCNHPLNNNLDENFGDDVTCDLWQETYNK